MATHKRRCPFRVYGQKVTGEKQNKQLQLGTAIVSPFALHADILGSISTVGLISARVTYKLGIQPHELFVAREADHHINNETDSTRSIRRQCIYVCMSVA